MIPEHRLYHNQVRLYARLRISEALRYLPTWSEARVADGISGAIIKRVNSSIPVIFTYSVVQ